MTMEFNVILKLCDIFCNDSNRRNSRKLLSKPLLYKTFKEGTYLVLHGLTSVAGAQHMLTKTNLYPVMYGAQSCECP